MSGGWKRESLDRLEGFFVNKEICCSVSDSCFEVLPLGKLRQGRLGFAGDLHYLVAKPFPQPGGGGGLQPFPHFWVSLTAHFGFCSSLATLKVRSLLPITEIDG
ncbi:hypothetical protein SAY86_022579 [Trapa natans]|uniref:Uncharacterized protein n=1 Tax=Trapa natans TaxID=22666 RepID=A0AAN7LUK4_TRANT|nr:hypothetical protein SAY86_022579 [Trapa natans]